MIVEWLIKLWGGRDLANKSSIRKWALGLTGWKWWAWQVGAGAVFFIIAEILLNKIGITMIPW
tara:strand:+ start:408 stop:596 length:189 start_codon:yes stop_codon:yes gene_type:complete